MSSMIFRKKWTARQLAALLNQLVEDTNIPEVDVLREEFLQEELDKAIYISRAVRGGTQIGCPAFSDEACSAEYVSLEAIDGRFYLDGMKVEFEGSVQPVRFFLRD